MGGGVDLHPFIPLWIPGPATEKWPWYQHIPVHHILAKSSNGPLSFYHFESNNQFHNYSVWIPIQPQWMVGLGLYFLLNSTSAISGQWKSEHEGLRSMKHHSDVERISPPAGFEPLTLWSEVKSVNPSAMQMLTQAIKYVSKSYYN